MTSNRGQKMLSYYPAFFQQSRFVQDVSENVGVELDDWQKALNEILDQFFVRTATWGLDTWENELGLAPAKDQPTGERRDRITSRLRGIGTATISVVKQVAESYDKGGIDVVEDFPAYTVTIQFVDTRGVPPNLDDLKAAVRAVVPAHLVLEYEFNYLIWDEIDVKNMTWDQWDALNLTWDQLEVYS